MRRSCSPLVNRATSGGTARPVPLRYDHAYPASLIAAPTTYGLSSVRRTHFRTSNTGWFPSARSRTPSRKRAAPPETTPPGTGR